MAIYTKTGDKGETSLYTGERVDKCSLRVQLYGTIDEIDSVLGISRMFVECIEVRQKIFKLQKLLSNLMADFASLNREPLISFKDVENLEKMMDTLETSLPPLKEFVIPGNSKGGAFLDLTRTVTRRAERLCCQLAKVEEVHEVDKIFLNRLSDLCFLLMRCEDENFELKDIKKDRQD